MRRFRMGRPSPALVVSIVALVVAMGGTGYAAFSLPKNSVGTKQLKNGAVTTKKLKNGAVTGNKLANGAVTGAKINLGTVGTVPSANHANSANTANSATSASSAQPAAFAHVSSTGTLDTGNSKNVGSVTFDAADNLYCIKGIPFTPRGGQATVDGNGGGAQDSAQFDLGSVSGCPAGTQAMVYTYSALGGGTATQDPFFVVFYA